MIARSKFGYIQQCIAKEHSNYETMDEVLSVCETNWIESRVEPNITIVHSQVLGEEE